jgi:hypothetical protein
MLVFRFQERYILHFFAPKKRRNPYSDYLVLVLQQALGTYRGRRCQAIINLISS